MYNAVCIMLCVSKVVPKSPYGEEWTCTLVGNTELLYNYLTDTHK